MFVFVSLNMRYTSYSTIFQLCQDVFVGWTSTLLDCEDRVSCPRTQHSASPIHKWIRAASEILWCVLEHYSWPMRFPSMWYVRPAKAQTSLRIRASWSEPLPVAWILYDSKATDKTKFGVSKLNRRLHRLVWVYTCQNATLLENTCRGSFILFALYWLSPGKRFDMCIIFFKAKGQNLI